MTVGGTTYFFGSVYGIHTDLGGGWTRVRFSGSEPGAGGFGGVIEAIAILVDEEGQSVLDNIDVDGTLIGKPGNAR